MEKVKICYHLCLHVSQITHNQINTAIYLMNNKRRFHTRAGLYVLLAVLLLTMYICKVCYTSISQCKCQFSKYILNLRYKSLQVKDKSSYLHKAANLHKPNHKTDHMFNIAFRPNSYFGHIVTAVHIVLICWHIVTSSPQKHY